MNIRNTLIIAVAGLACVGLVLWFSTGTDDAEPTGSVSPAPVERAEANPTRPAEPPRPALVASASEAADASDSLDADLSVLERRLQQEDELRADGLEARRALIERQTRRLGRAVERAESEGDQERARLLRQRMEHLSEMRADLENAETL